jgi:palmitoyltransferase ZDHHC9/14/18
VAKVEHTVETMEEVAGPLALAAAAPPAPHSAPDAPDSASRRPSRASRKSVVTYNVQILAGTAIHTPTKYLEKHHTNVLHGPLEAAVKPSPATTPKKRPYHRKAQATVVSDPAEQQLAAETAQAAQRRTSSRTSAADIRRNLSGVGEAVTNTFLGGKELMKSVLKRSASDSRLRSTTQNASSTSLKRRRTIQAAESEDEPEEEEEDEEEVEYAKPKSKDWMEQGLYVGQVRDFDARLSEKENRARRKSRQAPRDRKILPLPMFAAERMLNEDPRHVNRAFKLPYDVYNPLPRKVKVDGWIKISKSK